MSKFVKEGSVPESALDLQERKALGEEADFLKAEEAKTRKTLAEQLYDNRVRKALEYQKLTEAQNSAYKVSEKDLEYYESLKRKEEIRELDNQIQEEIGLEEFRNHKSKRDTAKKSDSQIIELSSVDVPKKVSLKRKFHKSKVSEGRKKPKLNTEEIAPECDSVSAEADELKQVLSDSGVQRKVGGLLGGYTSSSDEE